MASGIVNSYEFQPVFYKLYFSLLLVGCFASIVIFLRLLGSALFVFFKIPPQLDFPTAVGLGFLGLTLWTALIGHFFSLQLVFFIPIGLFALLANLFTHQPLLNFKTAKPFCKIDFALAAFLMMFQFAILITALMPQLHGDPLYYHLSSAWWWAKEGRFYFISWQPWSLQGGIAEYFYTFFALLTKERFSLLILGQLCHSFFSFFLSGMVVYQISRLFSSRTLSLVATICFCSFPLWGYGLVTAKNDGYVMFFSLLAIFYAAKFIKQKKPSDIFFIYLFSFYSTSIKYSAAFAVIPLLTVLFITSLQEGFFIFRRQHTIRLLVASIFALPIFFRNYIYTGNPLFPSFNSVFHSPFMNSYLEKVVSQSGYQPGLLNEILSSQLSFFLFSKPIFIFSLAVFWSRNKITRFLTLIFWTSFVLLCLVTGKGIYVRFALFLYGLLSILGVYGFYCLWQRFFNDRYKSIFVIACLSLSLINSQIDVTFGKSFKAGSRWLLGNESFKSFFSVEKNYYKMHEFINQKIETAKILSSRDNENLFLDVPLLVAENNIEAASIRNSTTFSEAILLYKDAGFSHLLFSDETRSDLAVLTEDQNFTARFHMIQALNGFQIWALTPSETSSSPQ